MGVLVLIVVLIFQAIWAAYMADAAEKKGYKDIHAFAICFWLGPIGYLYILALPDKNLQNKMDSVLHLLSKGSISSGLDISADFETEDELPEL